MKRIVLMYAMMVCCISAGYAVDGFGSATTGGAGGTTVVVTDPAVFKSYVETEDVAYIVQVSGIIDLGAAGGKVSIRSNKTIEGAGPGAGIIGQLGFKNGSSNVIIQRLAITNPNYGEGDGIGVKDDITNVFITKCTFYDCSDGCLDITNGSDYVTVSWCKFYYVAQASHRNVNLIGSSDSATDDMGKLHVTFHHNWWGSLCDQRLPSVRYGRAHVYNNYYDCPGNLYCIRTRLYAECLVENNYFKQVQNPWERYVTSAGGDPGLLHASGNILDEVIWNDSYDAGKVFLIDGTDTVFAPPYSYTLDDASLVPVIVEWGSGADGRDGYPPHWQFGMYGDFDLSGLVDMNDLPEMAGCWLATVDIENADYYDNGVVDGNEWALFASHWLMIPPDVTPPTAPADLWALGQDGQVSLQWSDSGEEDFVGYNIYRSETSGSGYTQLNSSLIGISEYIDNTAVNGTMYYYVVTAVDTSDNKSGYSAEACAVPDAASDSITIQENATGFCLSGDIEGIESEHSGYTGSGYANTYNETGTGVDYSIHILTAGTYTFTFRYAGISDRPANLMINNVTEVSGIAFTSTGAWTNWTTVSVPVTLTAGAKAVRLESTTSSGCANIDYLRVTGPAPEIAVCE